MYVHNYTCTFILISLASGKVPQFTRRRVRALVKLVVVWCLALFVCYLHVIHRTVWLLCGILCLCTSKYNVATFTLELS